MDLKKLPKTEFAAAVAQLAVLSNFDVQSILNSLAFGRIAAQTAKQVIDQKIHEAEKETVIVEFQKKIGGLVPGIVIRNDPYKMIVGVGKTEAIVPKDEQIKK